MADDDMPFFTFWFIFVAVCAVGSLGFTVWAVVELLDIMRGAVE